jgi:predicted DNA-binding transcriptional regulator AlpA
LTGARHLDTKEAADWLGLSARTLERWRLTGEGPPFRKLGRSVRYAIADLVAFADARTCTSTSSQGVTLGGDAR